tara:strand:+ start:5199 stop:5375 length:177 start_codon:yes stop_codon:yes gene_type:complete
MTERIRIRDAIVLLEMILAARNSRGRREVVEAALHDLRLALEDSEARALLHTPAENRP